MAFADVVSWVWALAEPVAASLGVELIEVEHAGGRKRQVLRLYIDKPGGVGLADCQRVSREVEGRLDAEDVIGSPYLLEVSSPGLERPLRRPVDFRRYVGRRVRLRLRGSQEGARKVAGVLRGIEGEVVAVETEGGERRSFSLGEIAKANLEVDWQAEFRGKPAGGEPDRAGEGGMGR